MLAGHDELHESANVRAQSIHGVIHMASWREISDTAKDPVVVRRIAEQLLALYRNDLTEWELDFLEGMLARGPSADEDLTTRQSEKLLQIRDDLKYYTNVDGLSVKLMIQNCYGARVDLDEADEEFLNRVRGKTSLRRGDVSRLLRCARELHLIHEYVDIDAGRSFF